MAVKAAWGNPATLESWDPYVDACSGAYLGVWCDNAGAGVSFIDLPGLDLSGPFPDALASLPQLTWLNLRDNPRLSGSLPVSFTTLSRLAYLDLGGTLLNGTLPAQYSMLGSLVGLTLGGGAAGLSGLSGALPPQVSLS